MSKFVKGNKGGPGRPKGPMERTLAEEACKRAGIDPFDLLCRKAVEGDTGCIIQLCKHIEPPKKPLEVAIDPNKSTIRIIVEDYCAKDTKP